MPPKKKKSKDNSKTEQKLEEKRLQSQTTYDEKKKQKEKEKEQNKERKRKFDLKHLEINENEQGPSKSNNSPKSKQNKYDSSIDMDDSVASRTRQHSKAKQFINNDIIQDDNSIAVQYEDHANELTKDDANKEYRYDDDTNNQEEIEDMQKENAKELHRKAQKKYESQPAIIKKISQKKHEFYQNQKEIMTEDEQAKLNQQRRKKRNQENEKENKQLTKEERRQKRKKEDQHLLGAARKKFVCETDVPTLDIGVMNVKCKFCSALWWPGETQVCCMGGKFMATELPTLPNDLCDIIRKNVDHFRQHSRYYNNMFSMTSVGVTLNSEHLEKLRGSGPPVYRHLGKMQHRIGSLLPPLPNHSPQYMQLNIFDTTNIIANRQKMISQQHGPILNKEVIERIQHILDEVNPFIQICKTTLEIMKNNPTEDVFIRIKEEKNSMNISSRYCKPQAAEIAGVMPERNFDKQDLEMTQDLIVTTKSDAITLPIDSVGHTKIVGNLQRICIGSPLYEPLHFTLLMPYGTHGWSYHMENMGSNRDKEVILSNGKVKIVPVHLTIQRYVAFRMATRSTDVHMPQVPNNFGQLFSEWLVTMALRIECNNLHYVKHNQKKFRSQSARDFLAQRDSAHGNTDHDDRGKESTIIPASMKHSPRQMYLLYNNAICMFGKLGKPEMLFTCTMNADCEAVRDGIRRSCPIDKHTDANDNVTDIIHETPSDRPDIVARVFELQKNEILRLITKEGILGEVIGHCHVYEWQKRSLPHIHALTVLAQDWRITDAQDIDDIIWAHIPDPEKFPELHKLVISKMMHNPCSFEWGSGCCASGKCKYGYPKDYLEVSHLGDDGYAQPRRPKTTHDWDKITKVAPNGDIMILDNRSVVPYNPFLLMFAKCHFNLEITHHINCVKYIFKYVFKGNSMVLVCYKVNDHGVMEEVRQIDEVEVYENCRYMCANEAVAWINSYHLHGQYPPVMPLNIHLPDQQKIYSSDMKSLEEKVARNADTPLTAWLKYNAKHQEGRHLTYEEFPEHFTYNQKSKTWHERSPNSAPTLGRLYSAYPKHGDLFYLRLILLNVKGATSYDDLLTDEAGTKHKTFKECAKALGLAIDDKEYYDCLNEAKLSATGFQMRKLYSVIIAHQNLNDPYKLFQEFQFDLCEDIVYHMKDKFPDITFKDERIVNEALWQIEEWIGNIRHLHTFEEMPNLLERDNNFNMTKHFNRMALAPVDIVELKHRINSLNEEQRFNFEAIKTAIDNDDPSIFHIDAYGGTGKTYLLNCLIDYARIHDKPPMVASTTGISAIVLHGGTTMHSRFKLPLTELDIDSRSGIDKDTAEANNIKNSKLLFIDEISMGKKIDINMIDYDISTNKSSAFGGRTTVFAGDFGQLLPIFIHGTEIDILSNVAMEAECWRTNKIIKLSLKHNMRVQSKHPNNPEEAAQFSQFLKNIRNGKHLIKTERGATFVKIPKDMCVRSKEELIDFVFPALNNQELLKPEDFNNRAILSTCNKSIDLINDLIIEKIKIKEHLKDHYTYKSIDSVKEEQYHHFYPVEFLNGLEASGLPKHEIKLLKGTPVLLIRNINGILGLCNGTRLIVIECGIKVLKCKIQNGSRVGDEIYIPRMTLQPIENTVTLGTMERHQFPIKVAYGMTINRAQSQTLDAVGIYLPTPVFAHGHLYVAMSRVGRQCDIKLFVEHDKPIFNIEEYDKSDDTFTENVVYHSIISKCSE